MAGFEDEFVALQKKYKGKPIATKDLLGIEKEVADLAKKHNRRTKLFSAHQSSGEINAVFLTDIKEETDE